MCKLACFSVALAVLLAGCGKSTAPPASTAATPKAAAVPAAPAYKAGWTPELVAADAKSCREGLEQMIREEFLGHGQYQEEDLPRPAKILFARFATPTVQSCNCVSEKIAHEFPAAEYQKGSPAAKARIHDLISNGGECISGKYAKARDANPDNSCVRYRADPKGFPNPTNVAARQATKARTYREGWASDDDDWAYYYDKQGLLAAEVDIYGTASKYGPAMIWRRVDWEGNGDILYSTRCEATPERCAAFDAMVQDTEATYEMGGKCS
jgi:hypothetical protein